MGEEPTVYCERADIEAIYGKVNVKTWSDLDNLGVGADIEARIDAAILWATKEIESRLRGGIYAIPFVTAEDKTPTEIIDLCATLAGVKLYEARGFKDVDPITGETVNLLSASRKRAERTINEILAGQRILDAIREVEVYPAGANNDEDDD